MVTPPKLIQRFIRYIKKNYVLVSLILIVLTICSIAGYKLFSDNEEVIYVRVKVSQGFWWASTLKPSVWFVDSIKKGDVERSLTGKKIAEILEVRVYPVGYIINGSEQYDTYLVVRMVVNKSERANQYMYKREPVLTGGPIDFEFQKAVISGTIMEFSEKPLTENYVEKIVTIQKNDADPWEYQAIQEGATYFDGEEIVVEVLEKDFQDTYAIYSATGNNYPIFSEPPINIKATLRITVKDTPHHYVFREEIPLVLGKHITLPLKSFVFNDFVVTSIQ